MDTSIYDIAVIGAGPAGTFFAKELAERRCDLKILLIDGQDETHKKPCGGLLAPDAQKLLAEFHLTLPNSILADPQIFAVETIDLSQNDVRYYQRHYLNMNRYAFDRWLLSLVPSSVEIVPGRCTEIQHTDNGYVFTISGQTAAAKAIIGADGANSIVRRSCVDPAPQLLQYVAIQEWYPARGQRMPYYSCIFDPETSDSCSWTIHKDGYVIFGGAFAKSGCREAFQKQKARLETYLGSSFGEPVHREACLVTSPRGAADFCCGADRAFLVGEAAGFISASSFEGISSAILSGKLLAEAFADTADAPNAAYAQIQKRYQKKTRGLRRKLLLKTVKRWVLCTPPLRHMIMRSGIQSIEKTI